MAILNKTQVDEMFKRESVLLGQTDCVPGFRVAHLFGRDAVVHAKKIDGGWNAYGIGDFTLFYLTHKGFQAAASFYNVQQLREEAEKEGASHEGVASPLSPAEQTLAEQNFYMVTRFLVSQRLSTDEWFDVVIFRYLLTVKNWFRRPELYQYEFSTIAWKAMSSAVHNERKKQDRRIKTISLDAPIPGTDGLTWGDIVTEDNQNYSIYARSVY